MAKIEPDDKMKQFDIDMSKGATSNVDIIPPPSLSHGDVPFSYMYASLQ
jgi:general transcription factor 3C polypeptide 5 (transcription factor C subunit 1)